MSPDESRSEDFDIVLECEREHGVLVDGESCTIRWELGTLSTDRGEVLDISVVVVIVGL